MKHLQFKMHLIQISTAILLIATLLVQDGASQGLYSIIAPNTLRPNTQYHVAVNVHQASDLTRIKLGIIASTYSAFKIVDVRPFSTELVLFEIPALKSDRYSLTAEGLSGILFTNETQLNFESKENTVLVQTDKSIYKPGDLVNFRILLVDPNLKPTRNYGRVHVELRDAGDNLIKVFQDIQFSNGVYSNELQLADYPKFGEWLINVIVGEEIYTNSFEVMEYILPKFVVDVDTPKHVIYNDDKIQATIRAYYDFGKAIVGEATLSIYPTFFGSLQPFVNDLITRKVIPIDGSAYFEFNIKDELRLKKDYEREYLLDALVEEKSTGSVQNFSTIITVHLDAYRVETIKIPKYYIPGVPFDVNAKILRTDGLNLGNNFKREVTAYLTNVYGGNEIYNKTNYNLDGNGEVKMKFTVPANDRDEYHSVIVDYMGIITDIGNVPRKNLYSKNYIIANVENDNAMVNKEITITVRSNSPLKYIAYQIIGRGDILLSRSIDVGENNFYTFKFLATFSMLPRAKLLVYSVINGEFVYDEQIIQFEEKLINTVDIEAPTRISPGQDIDLIIRTKPFSYVGVMIVDKNSVNIKDENDFTHAYLMDALKSYELNDINTPIGSPGKESGVVTMSNTNFIIENAEATTTSRGRSLSYDEQDDKKTTIRKTDIGPAHRIEVNTLAPGKGRYAFSYTPKQYWHNPRVHVMHKPENTWLFVNATAGSDGRAILRQRLPNTLTTWIVSAFAIDSVNGVGIANPIHYIETVKDFYITTDLPYSIHRDEVIAIPFVIFNNKTSDLDVDVTLYNTAQDFDFLPLDKNDTKPKIETYSRRTIRVLAKTSKSIAFIVTPKRIGSIIVKAVASSQLASDSLERTLLVEQSGITEMINQGFLFDMITKTQAMENVTIKIPRNSIPKSTTIEVKISGDIIGSILENLDQLIRLPTGCGEQTMINFIPNIMVLRNLLRTNRLTPTIEKQAKHNLEITYQRLLYYRHQNGGFSAFGLSENSSSTWLTAYAAKSLRQASEFIQVDENVIRTALEYLISLQQPNGQFIERGDLFEQFNDNDLSLTSFVTLALMENVPSYGEYRNNINKALDYITRGLDDSSELHAMAIGTYVLSRANHNSRIAFLQRLDAMAINQDGKKWWNKTAPISEGPSPWYNNTRTVNIEISSYAAMALLENKLLADAMPILKWLIDQRNDLGGFIATQDTIVGLQALFKFNENLSNQNNNVQIATRYGQGVETIANVNSANSMALQSFELPNSIKNLTISATGRGIVYTQVSYKYNTNVTSAWPRFVLDPTVNRNSHSDYLHLSACASFVNIEGDSERSNMAVMEIYLPSGFVVDTDTLPTLESSERIKKVETQHRNTVVIIYFDYLDRRQVCPTLHAYKTIKVAKQKPVPVIMYDYYDNARRARQFYRAPKSSICDICEHANCGSLCEKAEKRGSTPSSSDSSSNSKQSSNIVNLKTITILTIFAILLY